MRSPPGTVWYFPTVSLNSVLSFLQLIAGVGIPSAAQDRTAWELSVTVYCVSVLRILGGTVGRALKTFPLAIIQAQHWKKTLAWTSWIVYLHQ